MARNVLGESSPDRLVRPDILRWLPPKWELFLGNYRIIRHFRRLVKKIRKMTTGGPVADLNKLCFLLVGQSRSGKTALIKYLVRTLACVNMDEVTMDACGVCDACRQKPEQFGLSGLDSVLLTFGAGAPERIPLHFAIIDCTLIHTPEQLRNHMVGMCNQFDGVRIFYFDEVHRLVRHGMDEMLLKAVEEKEAVWFFSTARPEGLEDMFQNRLLKLATEPPSEEEMARWIVERCTEWGIKWEPVAVMRVVQKSNRVVGTALHALALASLDDDEGLTHDLVENDWHVKLDS